MRRQVDGGRSAWAALLCACAVTIPAFGDDNNTARVTLIPSFSGGNGPVDDLVVMPGTINISDATSGGFNSSGSGSQHTEYGMTHSIGNAFVALGTQCTGIVHDALTISAPGVAAGANGTLRYRVRVGGSINASSGSSVGRWGLHTSVSSGIYDISRQASFYSPSIFPSGYQGDPFGVYEATVSFRYGVAFSLDLEFNGVASAANDFTSTGEADFNIWMNWLGVDQLTANGVPVSTFTVSSQSGTQWAGEITGCVADFDASGFVDFDDFNMFVSAFEAGSGDADVDGSGFVDFDDFNFFVQAFEAGC